MSQPCLWLIGHVSLCALQISSLRSKNCTATISVPRRTTPAPRWRTVCARGACCALWRSGQRSWSWCDCHREIAVPSRWSRPRRNPPRTVFPPVPLVATATVFTFGLRSCCAIAMGFVCGRQLGHGNGRQLQRGTRPCTRCVHGRWLPERSIGVGVLPRPNAPTTPLLSVQHEHAAASRVQ